MIYRLLVLGAGWIHAAALSHLMGHRRRIRANLALIWPDLPVTAHRKIARDSAANLGRFFAELTLRGPFLRRIHGVQIEGPGMDAYRAAAAQGQPCIFATAHIGNHLACIQALTAHGIEAGILYRRRGNRLMDRRFDRIMRAFRQPLFKIGHRRDTSFQRDLARLVAHMRRGRHIGLVLDQRVRSGAQLPFLGKPAWTSLSIAELAVAHDAVLIPAYAERLTDGVSYRFVMEEPIQAGPPTQMMRRFNARVSDWITQRPGQWFWTMRRW